MKKFSVFITSFCLLLLYTGADENVCNTPGCVSFGQKILANMDKDVNPCDNFYQFMCGSFLKRENDTSPLDKVRSELNDDLAQILECKNVEDLPAAFTKAQTFYQSCMDIATVDAVGLGPMKEQLVRYGGWPVITPGWNNEKFDWVETTRLLSEDGHSTTEFAELKVAYSPLDTTKNVLTLWSPYFDPSDYAGGDPSKWYIELMIGVAMAFGATEEGAKKDMQEIFDFEKKLCDISQNDDRYDTNGKHMDIMTISDMNQRYPYADWNNFADAVLGRSVKITGSDTLYNELPSYFEALGKLLNQTPKRLIANYLLWNVILDMIFASSLDSKVMLLWQRYREHFEEYKSARKDICLGTVNAENWGAIVGPAYVHRYISPAIKQQGFEILKEFKMKLADIVKSQDWMDEQTKGEAVKKINNIILDIAYPDEFTNYDLINEYSNTLEINKGKFYENTFNNLRWARDKQDVKLRRPFDKASWEEFTYVTRVDAEFFEYNVIQFWASYLKAHSSADWPEFLNLINVGNVGGHEVTHAVEKYGSGFDSNGNARNWWTNETLQRFDAKVKAMVEEYSSYFVKEANKTIDGRAVTNEMISEHAAYMLVRKVLDDHISKNPAVKDSRVAGLEEYTPNQLSWIVPASYWCQKYNTQQLTQILSNFLPVEYRVNVPLRNSPIFAEDWKCPDGSWMNKKDKVNVW